MPKKLPKPTKKFLVNLYEGDQETLKEFFPDVGTGPIIRGIINRYCNVLREKANRSITTNDDAIAALAAGSVSDFVSREPGEHL